MKQIFALLTLVFGVALAAPAAAQPHNPPPPPRGARHRSSARASTPNLGTIRKDRHIGVGIGAGTLANGFSGKYILGDTLAFQANLGTCHRCDSYWWGGGYRWGSYGGIAVSADALLEMPALQINEMVRLGWNLGAGAGLGVGNFNSSLGVAVAVVAGFTVEFQPIPVDFVIEYRPSLQFFPSRNRVGNFVPFDLTAHLRFYIL